VADRANDAGGCAGPEAAASSEPIVTLDQANGLSEVDARKHALILERLLLDLSHQARARVESVRGARGRLLMEMTAEVLFGLAQANGEFGRRSAETR